MDNLDLLPDALHFVPLVVSEDRSIMQAANRPSLRRSSKMRGRQASEVMHMARDSRTSTKSSYTILSAGVSLVLALCAWRRRPENITPRDWGMLVLATFRMSRLLAYDNVMQAYRAPFAEVVPHDSGAGEAAQARPGTGIKRAIGELITCPVCNGTWIAAGLVYGLNLAPKFTRTLMTVMSAVGASAISRQPTSRLPGL